MDDYLSYGLYYQWGRKDPFIGPRHHGTKVKREETPGFSAATADYVVNTAYGGTFKLVKNTELPSGGEIGYAVANPMNFVCFGAEQNGSGQTWFNSDFKQYLTLWGYNEATSSSSKTIYDPCPVGYKVPHFTGMGRRCRCQSARDVERRALRRHVFGCGGFVVLSRCGLPRPYGRFPLLYGTVRYLLVGHDLQ